ncbi:TonB-dependent receptor, partial [Arthrospira platensis SPKY1]|nr:TonB-dependent receptor [Arthrospira platensis SPKY1]
DLVYAAYASFNRKLNEKININGGLRYEYTNSAGDLSVFESSLNEEPVKQRYSQWFPSMGLSYSIRMGNTINLNYSRRLNRPNYNVLNPFREQQSELSFSRGNPFLKPEILNNYEISYTHAFRYNFKLSYSKTIDQ